MLPYAVFDLVTAHLNHFRDFPSVKTWENRGGDSQGREKQRTDGTTGKRFIMGGKFHAGRRDGTRFIALNLHEIVKVRKGNTMDADAIVFSGIGPLGPRFREHCQAANLAVPSSFAPLTISYRAEEGEQGDGMWPVDKFAPNLSTQMRTEGAKRLFASRPQARNGRGMRIRAEVSWRPPEGAKRLKGCVCGISPQAKEVRTQSRRHLNTVKVETGRGKRDRHGRAATPQVNIASHGFAGSFILNDGVVLYRELDQILSRLPCRITIVIDACYAGSAVPHLDRDGREVYTACGGNELCDGGYDRRFAQALGDERADVDGDGVVEMWEADREGHLTEISFVVDTRELNPILDEDGDGLLNYFEENQFADKENYKHTNYGWGDVGIEADDAPDPYVKDIYVEIDYLTGCHPLGENSGTTPGLSVFSYILALIIALAAIIVTIIIVGGIISAEVFSAGLLTPLLIPLVMLIIAGAIAGVGWWYDTYVDPPTTKTNFDALINVFSEHDINLHIEIDDEITEGNGDLSILSRNGEYNDLTDFKIMPEYYNTRRDQVFHYVLFCNRIISSYSLRDRTFPLLSGQCGHNRKDGTVSGDVFIIDYVDDPQKSGDYYAITFMHELGHNLGLISTSDVHAEDESCSQFRGIDNLDEPYGYYESCMNYYSKFCGKLMDYSNGSNDEAGELDHDDWGNLRLERVRFRSNLKLEEFS